MGPWIVAVVVALALIGCGPVSEDPPGDYFGQIHGINIFVEPGYPTDGLMEEATWAIESAFDYWQVPYTYLWGWRFFFVTEATTCTRPTGTYRGCCDPSLQRIVLEPMYGCRIRMIGHEIGHAVIYDRDHTDPRWTGGNASTDCG